MRFFSTIINSDRAALSFQQFLTLRFSHQEASTSPGWFLQPLDDHSSRFNGHESLVTSVIFRPICCVRRCYLFDAGGPEKTTSHWNGSVQSIGMLTGDMIEAMEQHLVIKDDNGKSIIYRQFSHLDLRLCGISQLFDAWRRGFKTADVVRTTNFPSTFW